MLVSWLLVLSGCVYVLCDGSEQSDLVISPRIAGGTEVQPGDETFAYQVSIRDASFQYLCSGVILGQETVLTTAKCVHRRQTQSLRIVAGTSRLDEEGWRYEVSNVLTHPRYNTLTFRNDIALLTPTTPIVFITGVSFIPFGTDKVGSGVGAVLSGWGATAPSLLPWGSGRLPSNTLRYVNVETIGWLKCKMRLLSLVDDNSQVCASGGRRGVGACGGDSGAPLVVQGQLVGLASWGRPCGKGYPDVFTRVSYYAGWIQTNTGILP